MSDYRNATGFEALVGWLFLEERFDRLTELGVRSFWNFSHYDINVEHKNIIVENVHLGDSLLTLSYGVNNNLDNDE